jgi:hypothetical protein
MGSVPHIQSSVELLGEKQERRHWSVEDLSQCRKGGPGECGHRQALVRGNNIEL